VSPRRCPDCGLAEERLMIDGKPYLNLDPVSGRCLTCLAVMAKSRLRTIKATLVKRDVKLAQLPAHDDED
jgi:hypothetical protein